jgi:uncharacterized protein (DUF1330 family)
MTTKAYWIGRVEVTNMDEYKNYVALNGAAFSKYGARFLVRGGSFEVAEGGAKSRNVVIEFPSYEQAVACYHSPEYSAAIAARKNAAFADLIIINGYDGPQPA